MEEVHSKDLSQEEIQDHFEKADKLFEGKKFEDGAVVDECPECKGRNGFHSMRCLEIQRGEQTTPDEGEVAVSTEPPEDYPLEQNEVGEMLPGRLPPTAEEFMSNDMMWLIAKCCHEVNRAYCSSIGDHSHLPWEATPPELRASVYSGVEYHRDNSGVSPEESHARWMKYKLAEGWVFGNVKDVDAKTHPNLIAFHQLHKQERAKDSIFTAICDTFFGGTNA